MPLNNVENARTYYLIKVGNYYSGVKYVFGSLIITFFPDGLTPIGQVSFLRRNSRVLCLSDELGTFLKYFKPSKWDLVPPPADDTMSYDTLKPLYGAKWLIWT